MESTDRAPTPSAPLVALIAWILPGAGYLLLRQRGRALGVGISIIALFILGLLIGGVRVIEVPGFDTATGQKQMINVMAQELDPDTHQPMYDSRSGLPVMAPAAEPGTNRPMKRWVLQVSPLDEIRDKPWSVPQVLTGPIAILSAAWSVHAAALDPSTGTSIGALTHARVNEIGSLYLSVAGLLNLMAIIDSAWRASHLNGSLDQPEPAKEFA
jgi:hypothetical protein